MFLATLPDTAMHTCQAEPKVAFELRADVSCPSTTSFAELVASTSAHPSFETQGRDTSKTTFSFKVASHREWSDKNEKTFHQLAVKEALGETSIEEQAQLRAMERERNSLFNPRSHQEILAEKRILEKTEKLIAALDEFFT